MWRNRRAMPLHGSQKVKEELNEMKSRWFYMVFLLLMAVSAGCDWQTHGGGMSTFASFFRVSLVRAIGHTYDIGWTVHYVIYSIYLDYILFDSITLCYIIKIIV